MGYPTLLGGGFPTSFRPENLSGKFSWLIADRGITLNGSDVEIWEDQSGNGKGLRQSTATNQPAYSSADAVLNNRASLTFSTNDFMAAQAATDWKFLHDGTGCTIAFEIYPVGSAGAVLNPIFDTASIDANNIGMALWRIPNTGNLRWNVMKGTGALVINATGAGALPANTKAVVVLRYKEGETLEYDMRVNRVSLASGATGIAPSASDPFTTLYVSANAAKSLFGNHKIPEILFLNRYASNAEVGKIENYFRGRYGSI